MDYPGDPSIGLVNGKFINDDPGSGLPGSIIDASWANAIMSELLGVIRDAGLTPDENQTDQLSQALNARFDPGDRSTAKFYQIVIIDGVIGLQERE